MTRTWSPLLLLVCTLLHLGRGIERSHDHRRLARHEPKFIPTSVTELGQPMNGGFVGTQPVEVVLSQSTTEQPYWAPIDQGTPMATGGQNRYVYSDNGNSNGYGTGGGGGGVSVQAMGQVCTQCMTNGLDYCISTNRCSPRAKEYCNPAMGAMDHITGDAAFAAKGYSMTCPGAQTNSGQNYGQNGQNPQMPGQTNSQANNMQSGGSTNGINQPNQPMSGGVDQGGAGGLSWTGGSATTPLPTYAEGNEPSQQNAQGVVGVPNTVGIPQGAVVNGNVTVPQVRVAFPKDPALEQNNKTPLGHIFAVLGCAIFVIFLPAAYVTMQGKNPAAVDYEKGAGKEAVDDTRMQGVMPDAAGVGIAQGSGALEVPPPPPTEAPDAPLIQN